MGATSRGENGSINRLCSCVCLFLAGLDKTLLPLCVWIVQTYFVMAAVRKGGGGDRGVKYSISEPFRWYATRFGAISSNFLD